MLLQTQYCKLCDFQTQPTNPHLHHHHPSTLQQQQRPSSTALTEFSLPTHQAYDVLTFRSPGEVANIQPKGTVLLISTTNPHCMNSAWANLRSETNTRVLLVLECCTAHTGAQPSPKLKGNVVSVTMTNPSIGRYGK